MGKGTTMGWMGWREMATAVRVPKGRGCPSFFMAGSCSSVTRGAHRPGQPPCRGETGSSWRARLPVGAGKVMRAGSAACAACAFLALSGCVQGPLSALDPASQVTRSVAALWWSMAAGTGIILLLMLGLAVVALRCNPPRAPGRRGVLALLVGGGLMLPGVVIVALLAFGLRLDQAQWPPGAQAEAARAFHVDVVAHQWWWEARYPDVGGETARAGAGAADTAQAAANGGGYGALRTVNVLHVPAGVPIHLRIMATDVIHGFWVPRVAGKLDAVPGKVNRIRLMVDEPGEYAGVCAEYCGDGHAHMRFTVVAHPPEELPRLLTELAEGRP